jgi:natural product biosynthesis luciferase-like monooxygenase protein
MIFENYPVQEMVEQEMESEYAAKELTLLSAEIYERNSYNFSVMITPGDTIVVRFEYDEKLYNEGQIDRLQDHFSQVIDRMLENPAQPVYEVDCLGRKEYAQLLDDFNATSVHWPEHSTIVDLFERQVEKAPNDVALAFEETSLTYSQLNEKANRLADYLRRNYRILPDHRVGIQLERNEWIIISILGILKSGGGYVPIDPAYPRERIDYMIADSNCRLVIDKKELERFAAGEAMYTRDNLRPIHNAGNISYVIYTSGSTGKPKGVIVRHKNVVNFFAGMSDIFGTSGGTMLALTNYTFDISILELVWTLTLGFKVVLQKEAINIVSGPGEKRAEHPLDFSLFYFGNAMPDGEGADYKLLMDGARFADKNGFTAVWTPERHFHEFGGLYPNPSVTGAALAAITENISIRAGSVVLPLNNPLRVAEEWAVIDNLSGGRAGIACASGWHANDFVLAPGNYKERYKVMYGMIDTIRKLWNGGAIPLEDGNGRLKDVQIFPRPVQKELPLWITSAGNIETFVTAGRLGLRVLTHMLGATVEELTLNISAYRKAYKDSGHMEGKGYVTLMLHTFIGEDIEGTYARARKPFIDYLRSSLGLVKNLAASMGYDISPEALTGQDLEDMLDHSFNRYVGTSSLIGTKETCMTMLETLHKAGVDEIACLVDFGVDHVSAMESLKYLNEIKNSYNADREDYSVFGQLNRHKVSYFQSTPSMAVLLNAGLYGQQQVSSLKKILLGGESLPLSLVKELYAKFPGAEIYNMYGPTETTIWSACFKLSPDTKKVLIGKPIANTRIHILSDRMQLLPVGAIGEICIGGNGVAGGYINRADLTSERFIRDPFLPDGILYRTGDYGRWLEDGNIEYIGRKDDQVKIMGHRIELGEIETALLRVPSVEAAVVAARKGAYEEMELVAYVVSKAPLNILEVRSGLSETLPAYMVPAHFVQLEGLPLTPNGKVDKKSLPIPEELGMATGTGYAAPRNMTEEKLVSIWKEILRKDSIGIRDDFFRSGGNSIRSMQLVARINREFEVKLPLKTLFNTTVLEDQARLIRQAGRTSYIHISPAALQSHYPLSSSQRRLWLLSQMENSNIVYNESGVYVFEGGLDIPALEYSFTALLQRHEILRTVFKEDDRGEVRQFINSVEDVHFMTSIEDLRCTERQEEILGLLLEKEIMTPFDLSEGPLLRSILFRIEDDKWVFCCTTHHIVSDGWSMTIFIKDLLSLYNDFQAGVSNSLSPLPIQYKDYAVWQQQQLGENGLSQHKSYWLRQFEGDLPLLEFPGHIVRPPVKTYNGGVVTRRLDNGLSGKLSSFIHERGGTLFMGLLASVNTLLYRYTGQSDIIIGTPISEREHIDLEEQIGFYLNTLALRSRFKKEDSFEDLFREIKKTTLDAYEHRSYPFDELVDSLDLRADAGRNFLFDVWIVLQDNKILDKKDVRDANGLTMTRYDKKRHFFIKFDLLFSFAETEEGLYVNIEYNTDIFNKSEVEHLHAQFEDIVRCVMDDPAITLIELGRRLDDLEKEAQKAQLEKVRRKNIANLSSKSY